MQPISIFLLQLPKKMKILFSKLTFVIKPYSRISFRMLTTYTVNKQKVICLFLSTRLQIVIILFFFAKCSTLFSTHISQFYDLNTNIKFMLQLITFFEIESLCKNEINAVLHALYES